MNPDEEGNQGVVILRTFLLFVLSNSQSLQTPIHEHCFLFHLNTRLHQCRARLPYICVSRAK